MCAGCAMMAASAATGVRSWLHTRDWSFLTPRRLKLATIVLIVLAFGFSAVRFSGSTPAQAHHPPAHGQVR
jgi:hypothetical protein